MAYPTYRLGSENFANLTRTDNPRGMPGGVARVASIFQRPGVDGTSVRIDGVKGQPFGLRSFCDFGSFSACTSAIGRYRSMILEDRYSLIIADVDMESVYGSIYVVLSCEPSLPCRCAVGVGGLNNGSFYVEAFWELIPVEP